MHLLRFVLGVLDVLVSGYVTLCNNMTLLVNGEAPSTKYFLKDMIARRTLNVSLAFESNNFVVLHSSSCKRSVQ